MYALLLCSNVRAGSKHVKDRAYKGLKFGAIFFTLEEMATAFSS
jgi:hypothetical protein